MKNSNKNKTMNFTHSGYILYDTDLMKDYFEKSLKEVIGLHDVFNHKITSKGLVQEPMTYEFKSVHCLDQMGLKDVLQKEIKTLKQSANFTFIYFNNNLRGFYYQFNGFLFDERSVKRVLQAIEKQYFKGKFKQLSTSYSKYVEDMQPSFKMATKRGQFQSYTKILTLDEDLTKRVRAYCKEQDINVYQFLVGIIGIYYKTAKHYDMKFESNFFEDEQAVIGYVPVKKSYQLKKNPHVTLGQYIKNDWVELNNFSKIKVHYKDKFKELKGQVETVVSKDVPYEIGFFVDEKDWEIVLEIVAQKYKFKKDDLYLMLTKLRMIIFDVLEKDLKVSELELLTSKEKDIALSHATVKQDHKHHSLLEQLKLQAQKYKNEVCIALDKSISYDKFYALAEKYASLLKKKSIQGKGIQIQGLSDVDRLAMFFALDSTDNSMSAKGFILKKGLFGYKITGSKEETIGLYNNIQAQGYRAYCHDMRQYFHMDKTTKVHISEWLKFGVPCLLSGGQIVQDDTASIRTLDVEALKPMNHLQHAVVNSKFVDDKFDYKVHYGVSLDSTVPISFIGPIKHGKVNQIRPVHGLGYIILNKQKKLTQAFEKGKLYGFGPAVALTDNAFDFDTQDINISKLVDLDLIGSYYLDESLRI